MVASDSHWCLHSRARVGRLELRSLLGDPEGGLLGSRTALSPMRAPSRLCDTLGGHQVAVINVNMHPARNVNSSDMQRTSAHVLDICTGCLKLLAHC